MVRRSGDQRSRRQLEHRSVLLRTYLCYRTPKKLAIYGIVILLLVFISMADRGGYLPVVRSHHSGHYERRAYTVVRVPDGDKIDVVDPTYEQKVIHVRLWGVDTPEKAKQLRDEAPGAGPPLAELARQFTQQLCLGQLTRLSVETHRLRGQCGRLLAYVYLPDGTVLNERLLAAGLARADDQFEHGHLRRYALLQQQAQIDQVGLWAQ